MKSAHYLQKQRGFTLIEVMVALMVVALALSTLYVTVLRSIRATYHAQMISQATLLARYKMAEIEDQFLTEAFTDRNFGQNTEGSFFSSDEGTSHPLSQNPGLREMYRKFRFKIVVDKVQLPSLDGILGGVLGGMNGTPKDSVGSSATVSGSATMIINQVRDVIEQRVRKVTLQIFWDESDKKNQSIEMIALFTDPSPPSKPSKAAAPGSGRTSSPSAKSPSSGGGL